MTTAAERGLELVRELILSRDLLPGQQVRQAALAERLGLGSIPMREALAVLRGEGLLDYVPHAGYCVARVDQDELIQIYRMRDLLENELLSAIDLAPAERKKAADELSQILEEHEAAFTDERFAKAGDMNRAFHLAIFDLSPSRLVAHEARKLYNRLAFYRLPHMQTMHEEEIRRDVVSDHHEMIRAIRDGDTPRLVEIAQAHRKLGHRRLEHLM